MLHHYVLLLRRFSAFAQQAEWVSSLLFKHQDIHQLPIHNLLMQYLKYREGMASKLLSYENNTRSFVGWIKSCIPGTLAFKARTEIGNNLIEARNLYLEISIAYYKYIQNVHHPKKGNTGKSLSKNNEIKMDDTKKIYSFFQFNKKSISQEKHVPIRLAISKKLN